MIVAADQRAFHLGLMTWVRRKSSQLAAVFRSDGVFRHQIVQVADILAGHVGHAVVGQHDQVHAARQAARLQAIAQPCQRGIDIGQRLFRLR